MATSIFTEANGRLREQPNRRLEPKSLLRPQACKKYPAAAILRTDAHPLASV